MHAEIADPFTADRGSIAYIVLRKSYGVSREINIEPVGTRRVFVLYQNEEKAADTLFVSCFFDTARV